MAKKGTRTMHESHLRRVVEEIPTCRVMELPPEVVVEAAKGAIEENPANRPCEKSLAKIIGVQSLSLTGGFQDPVIQPWQLAVMTTKYWGSKGVKLSVGFMERTSRELANRILSHMNAWSEFSNVEFHLVDSPNNAKVRITREGDGYWSYLGTDILQIPVSQPTMCLQRFTMETSESEYKRVVRHETGHTCGYPHEHMRRELVERLDPQKTMDWAYRTMGWTPQVVKAQILTPIEEAYLMATEKADSESIMCYMLPASITKDGQPIPGGNDINERDKEHARKLYPKEIVNKPSPPTPNPKGNKMTVETLKQWLTNLSDILNSLRRWVWMIPPISWTKAWLGDLANLLTAIGNNDDVLNFIVGILDRVSLTTLGFDLSNAQRSTLGMADEQKLLTLQASQLPKE